MVGFTIEELETLLGHIILYVNGTMEATLGEGFQTGLAYAQGDIPASFFPPAQKEGNHNEHENARNEIENESERENENANEEGRQGIEV